MPITAPAGPPITLRQAHAATRPEKTSKQGNNRQQSLNTLVILSSERFPFQLLKHCIKHNSHRQQSLNTTLVFSPPLERLQISSHLLQIEGIGTAHGGMSLPDWVQHCMACHFWARCCSTSREIDGVSTGAGRPVQ